jgi:hypothetical protein
MISFTFADVRRQRRAVSGGMTFTSCRGARTVQFQKLIKDPKVAELNEDAAVSQTAQDRSPSAL